MLYLKSILVLSVMCFSINSFAGIIELSLNGNYKNSKIDEANYKLNTGLSTSISYFFGEMSALEFSYSNSEEINSLRQSVTADTQVTTYKSTFYGVDFVLSFASRKSQLQPFIKIGAAKLVKKTFYKETNVDEKEIAKFSGLVPSAGAGMRMKFTQTFSLKMGIDAWSVKNDSDNTTPDFKDWDYAGRVGLSWLF